MTDFSPAAQAVFDAAFSAYWSAEQEAPNDEGMIAAAALRAAADQVVPIKEEPAEPPGYGIGYEPAEYVQDWTRWHVRRQLRHKLLGIAAELEGGND
jgi:hypothetical protein